MTPHWRLLLNKSNGSANARGNSKAKQKYKLLYIFCGMYCTYCGGPVVKLRSKKVGRSETRPFLGYEFMDGFVVKDCIITTEILTWGSVSTPSQTYCSSWISNALFFKRYKRYINITCVHSFTFSVPIEMASREAELIELLATYITSI